jgi:hypothetical protein
MSSATDYALSNSEANELKGAMLLPFDVRQALLKKYFEKHGSAKLIDLFAQFIGLANSVVENSREMIEILGITQGGEHPYTVEKYNLPTTFGALCGVELANAVNQRKTCVGCAYRLGTPANQSPVTTCDADYCVSVSETDFLCHLDLDEKGNPKHLCLGHAQRAKASAA